MFGVGFACVGVSAIFWFEYIAFLWNLSPVYNIIHRANWNGYWNPTCRRFNIFPSINTNISFKHKFLSYAHGCIHIQRNKRWWYIDMIDLDLLVTKSALQIQSKSWWGPVPYYLLVLNLPPWYFPNIGTHQWKKRHTCLLRQCQEWIMQPQTDLVCQQRWFFVANLFYRREINRGYCAWPREVLYGGY